MDLEKEIRTYLKAVRKDVAQQIKTHNFIASGRMLANFRVAANQFLAGEIRGVFYMNFLQEGATKPKGVNRAFIKNIVDWMRFRGIQPKRRSRDGALSVVPSTVTNIKRAAFGIAKGIVADGTPATRREKNLDIVGAMNRHKSEYLEAIGKQFLLTFEDNLKIK